MKIFPSSRVTRIQTIGASRLLWTMAENRYLQGNTSFIVLHTSRQRENF